MTWTRERPDGVDCVRNFRLKSHPSGFRLQECYAAADVAEEEGQYGVTDSWWHPVRADGRYPPLPATPSDELPAPLTPAFEGDPRDCAFTDAQKAAFWAPQAFADGVRETAAEYRAAPPIKTPTCADMAFHLTAPEPSRLEIAARIMAAFASRDDQERCKSTTPEGIEAERNEYAHEIAKGCVRWADALIAAARKGGGA